MAEVDDRIGINLERSFLSKGLNLEMSVIVLGADQFKNVAVFDSSAAIPD